MTLLIFILTILSIRLLKALYNHYEIRDTKTVPLMQESERLRWY